MVFMETPIIPTTKINIDLRTEYDLTGSFEPDTKIAVIEYADYISLITILTPEQHEEILTRAQSGRFRAVAGYVTAKI